jgi:hypothetical protein
VRSTIGKKETTCGSIEATRGIYDTGVGKNETTRGKLDAMQSTSEAMRETLFGDQPLSRWPPAKSNEETHEPWMTFVAARNAMARDDNAAAIEQLRRVLAMPALESRHYLQAWHVLRLLKVEPPPEKRKEILGVVVEVQMNTGHDLLAAYRDHSARYWNYAGGGVVWERPDASLDPLIDALFAAAQPIVDAIGPWEGRRPPLPGKDEARMNFLTPSGLHFGQAKFAILARDPMARPAIDAATALMQTLVAKSGR